MTGSGIDRREGATESRRGEADPMTVLGGGAVSYGRGIPTGPFRIKTVEGGPPPDSVRLFKTGWGLTGIGIDRREGATESRRGEADRRWLDAGRECCGTSLLPKREKKCVYDGSQRRYLICWLQI